ncbi:hypothetical protein BGZ94_000042 [Podila epigama]|nr:hypothetical protein BGZ94_000042 [Podila epigama]
MDRAHRLIPWRHILCENSTSSRVITPQNGHQESEDAHNILRLGEPDGARPFKVANLNNGNTSNIIIGTVTWNALVTNRMDDMSKVREKSKETATSGIVPNLRRLMEAMGDEETTPVSPKVSNELMQLADKLQGEINHLNSTCAFDFSKLCRAGYTCFN